MMDHSNLVISLVWSHSCDLGVERHIHTHWCAESLQVFGPENSKQTETDEFSSFLGGGCAEPLYI